MIIQEKVIEIANKISKSTRGNSKNVTTLLGYSLEEDFNQALSQNPRDYASLRDCLIFPDIDLVIRPKEMRVSKGPVYAMAQSQMIILDKLNPEVTREDLEKITQGYEKLKKYRVKHSHNSIHQK